MCVFVLLYNMFFWIYIYIPSLPRYLKIVKLIYIYIFKIQKKTLMGGGSNWMISYIYIRFAGSLIWGLLGWPIINMMTIYVCICVFLFCYTICFFGYIYIPSVPRHLKIVIFIYIFKIQKKHWCGGGVLTEWFRIYIYDLLAVSYKGCWGGPSSTWWLFMFVYVCFCFVIQYVFFGYTFLQYLDIWR